MRTRKSSAPFRDEWAEAVRLALNERPYRQIAKVTGISASYLADWVQGKVPIREKVLEFARVMGGDPNLFLEAAGYEPLTPRETVFAAMQEVLDGGLTIKLELSPEEVNDPEAAQQIAAGLRAMLRAGKI